MGLTWWIGLALAPTVGTQLLTASAAVTFIGSVIAAGAAGVSMLALDRRLPDASRRTLRLKPVVRIDAVPAPSEAASG